MTTSNNILNQYQDQIQDLMTYIQVKGHTFQSTQDMRNQLPAIMRQWINDGQKFMNQVTSNDEMRNLIYKTTVKNINK